MKQRALFRQQAMDHQTSKIYGTVSINVPMPYAVVTYGFGLLLLGFFIFSLITDYTEHYLVKGYLDTKTGMARIYPLSVGIIRKQYVVIGQHVRQGDPLYSVDTSYDNFAQHLPKEYQQLQSRLVVINHDIALKQHHLQQLKKLLEKRYISLMVYQKVRDEIGFLEANRSELTLALIRYQQSRCYVIRASIAGEISSMEYTVGQVVHPTKPLLTIVPYHSELIAHLYIPVSKSGFIAPQDTIALRYDAYPYQHFGIATGHIVSVTHSVLVDSDEDKPLVIGEPYYKAIAVLDTQRLQLSGQAYQFHQGMTFAAVLSGARKTIWHWMVDPIV